MAKRKPSEVICSFCLKTILTKDAYTVKLKMHQSLEEMEGNVYHTPCCEGCLDSDRIIGIREEPKSKQKKK